MKHYDTRSYIDLVATVKAKESNYEYAVQKFIGETEMIRNNLSPSFKKSFVVMYQFNRDRDITIQIWNHIDIGERDLFGEVTFRLTSIMMSEKHAIEVDLTSAEYPGKILGRLHVSANSKKHAADIINFQISASLNS